MLDMDLVLSYPNYVVSYVDSLFEVLIYLGNGFYKVIM